MNHEDLDSISHRVSVLAEFEQYLWPRPNRTATRKPSNRSSRETHTGVTEPPQESLNENWRSALDFLSSVLLRPEVVSSANASFFEGLMRYWEFHIQSIFSLRDSLVAKDKRSSNPVADINSDQTHKAGLLESMSLPPEEAGCMSLNEAFPFLFVVTYDGNTHRLDERILSNMYGHNVWDPYAIRHGVYCPATHGDYRSRDNWSRNSVVWQIRDVWPTSPKNRPSDSEVALFARKARRHETRHALDFMYALWQTPTEENSYFEWRLLLEIAASCIEQVEGKSANSIARIVQVDLESIQDAADYVANKEYISIVRNQAETGLVKLFDVDEPQMLLKRSIIPGQLKAVSTLVQYMESEGKEIL